MRPAAFTALLMHTVAARYLANLRNETIVAATDSINRFEYIYIYISRFAISSFMKVKRLWKWIRLILLDLYRQ